ncbi:21954_t:CDS:2 [Entrophospora sp. SA101]|nr:17683_t:CDS:2 [Entrophospora sp. SA101]CAJ0757422.1 21954_t:CDS:2 [Entrophospora sp. SA101]
MDGINNTVKIFNGKDVCTVTTIEWQKLQSKSQESKKIGLSIDLFMCHGSYKKVALWLLERLSQAIRANEALDPMEAIWISNAMVGGIIWAQNDWKGYGRQYDETSLYPSIMQSAITFPISKGKFQILKDFVKKHENGDYAIYGIYWAEVEYKKDMKVLFRYNKCNKYTHTDLSYARTLGLQVKLIQDNFPNSGIIGQVSKRVLNTLWGALCQRNKSYYDVSEGMVDLFKNPEGEILDNPTKPPSINCLENASKILKTLKFEKESKCHVKNANQVTWYEC